MTYNFLKTVLLDKIQLKCFLGALDQGSDRIFPWTAKTCSFFIGPRVGFSYFRAGSATFSEKMYAWEKYAI